MLLVLAGGETKGLKEALCFCLGGGVVSVVEVSGEGGRVVKFSVHYLY